MRHFYLLLFILFIGMVSFSQGSWKVALNGKTVLTSSSENEENNIATIKTTDLEKKKDFTLVYTEKKKTAGWERFITLYDEKEAELNQQKSVTFKLSNKTLQSYFKKSKKLKLYTWALPVDPKLKAAIRVRRVHLCTLILE